MINRHCRIIRFAILFLACSGTHTMSHAQTVPAIPMAVGTVEIAAKIKYAAWLSLENAFDNFDAYCDSFRLGSQPLGSCSNRLFTPLPVYTNQPAGDCIFEQYWWGKLACGRFTGGNIHYLCPEGYTYWATDHTRCINTQIEYFCPEVAAGETPFTPDSGGLTCSRPDQCKSPDVTDPATGQCVHCTVNPLPQPPFEGDTNPACTASLEKGKGKDVDHKCPSLNPKMTEPNGGQIQCLADKINKLALTPAYTGPSATIRTEAYQQHLVDIWKKSLEIAKLKKDAEKQACATEIADVTREKKDHGIDFSPSKKKNDAPHVKGNALDIPRDVALALKAKLTDTNVIAPVNCFLGICMSIPVHIGDVQDYVNSPILNPPACDLLWGGRFGDKVHFQLQHP